MDEILLKSGDAPGSLQPCTIPGLSEISHRPDGWSGNVAETRRSHRDPNSEENLIPTAHHTAFVIQIVNFLRECDLQDPVVPGDGCGVTPLGVARLAVVQVDGFSEWIVAEVKRSTAVVEFGGEDQLEFRPCRSPIRSFLVV